jgi:hypothetical protein
MIAQLQLSNTVERFLAVARETPWCTVATVDRRGRPRSRILHPVWRQTPAGLEGWVTTRPTPLKLAHLAHSPYVSCSYWRPNHDTAVAECAASWVADPHERAWLWEYVAALAPPVGFDPSAMWPDGPESPDFAVLHLRPWRLRVGLGAEMAEGILPRAWMPSDQARNSAAASISHSARYSANEERTKIR